MQISITGQHLDITPALTAHIEQKMRRTEDHFKGSLNAHVVLTHQASKAKEERNQVEITVHLQGKILHASAIHGDMYSAIDQMAEKINRQIDKYKTQKKFDHSVPIVDP